MFPSSGCWLWTSIQWPSVFKFVQENKWKKKAKHNLRNECRKKKEKYEDALIWQAFLPQAVNQIPGQSAFAAASKIGRLFRLTIN